MSTEAQIAANIANAQHSTGPRTEAGKARTALNARTHGLTARDLVIAPDEQEEFSDFFADLQAELRPEPGLEAGAFAQVIHAGWNLRRIRRMEAELFQIEPNLLLTDASTKAFDRIQRYKAATERTYNRARKELADLQTNRALRKTIDATVAAAVPPLASMRLLKQTRKSMTASDLGIAIAPVDQRTPPEIAAYYHAIALGQVTADVTETRA